MFFTYFFTYFNKNKLEVTLNEVPGIGISTNISSTLSELFLSSDFSGQTNGQNIENLDQFLSLFLQVKSQS